MRRFAPVVLCVLAACGRSPSTPASPSPGVLADTSGSNFSGLWSGAFRIATCEGDRHCVLMIGTTRTFELRLQQLGSRVHGLFVANNTATDVSGEVLKDGSLVLNGDNPGSTARDFSTAAHAEIRLTADALQGTVYSEIGVSPQYEWPYGAQRLAGEIVSTVREDLAVFVADPSGTWVGRFAVRSCTPLGVSCYPARDQDAEPVEMTLSRNGATLQGRITSGWTTVPLAGSISGSAVTLSGEFLSPSSGGDTRARVKDWRGTIDEFGRMKGSFDFDYAYPVQSPTLGEAAAVELWQLVKRR